MRVGGGGGRGFGGRGQGGGGRGGKRKQASRMYDEVYRERSSRARYRRFREIWKANEAKTKQAKAKRHTADDPDTDPDAARSGLASDQDWQSQGKVRKDKDTRRRFLRRYYLWLRPFWGRLLGLTIVGLVVSAMDLYWAWVGGRMLDVASMDSLSQALPPWLLIADWSREQWLWTLGLSALAVIVLARLIALARNLATRTINAQVTFRLRRQLFQHIVRLPLSDIHDMKSGGVISRLSTDVDGTIGLVQQAVLSPAAAVIRLVLTTVFLLTISWQVTVAALALLIGCGIIYNGFLRTVRPIYRSMGEDRARVDGRVAETFGGLRVVRAFAREPLEELEYGVGHHTVIRKQLWAHARQQILFLFWEMLMPLTSLVIMGMGAWLVLRGDLRVGDVFTISALAFQVLNPVFILVNSMTETQRSLAAMERVYEVLERPREKPDRIDAVMPPSSIDTLVFDQLSFAYGYESEQGEAVDLEGASMVLQDINLTVPGGSIVAFVGPSGAGKTTLTDLIARFQDPSVGRILINGRDLREYRLADYRAQISIVQQETFLFDGTIRDNIAYSRRDASDADIIDAAKRANAWEFIDELPDGMDSLVGERGVKLSGGQRQRLAIARAILADPAILILDEATSNLDTHSEQLIQAAMEELFAGRTTFVVAHRLSTIQNADIIAVIEGGRIVQQGDHESLMAAGPGTSYHDMVMRQRTRALIEDPE